MLYNAEFPDGADKKYSSNAIANNVCWQVDQDEFSQTLLESILDCINDGHAVTKDKMYVTTKVNRKILQQTTFCLKLLVKFRDGSRH